MQDDRLGTAFELLRNLVDEMYEANRRTYAASVKPQLLERTAGGFSERDLGFRSFREFIQAAEDAGVVETFPAPVGPDIEIVPAGRPSKEAERRVADGAARRIRRPVWEAFMDWTPGQLRVFDRETGRVVRIPREAVALEPEDNARLRAAAAADPERYVEIPMIEPSEQERWMSDYLAVAPKTPALSAVELAVSSPTPFRAFAHAVQIDGKQLQAWREYRLRRVTEFISAWERENGASIDALEPSHDASVPAEEQATSHTDGVLASAREAVHAAVDRMPLEALNRLHIPVEYLVGS